MSLQWIGALCSLLCGTRRTVEKDWGKPLPPQGSRGTCNFRTPEMWCLQYGMSVPPQEHTGSGGPGPFPSHVASPKTLIYV